MKNERCPNCDGMLGVPDKLRGLPVHCPVCKLEFVPDSTAQETPPKSSPSRPKIPNKPSLRSVPLPAAIASVTGSSKSEPPIAAGRFHDDMLPPTKARSNTLIAGTDQLKSAVEPVIAGNKDTSTTVTDDSLEPSAEAPSESAKQDTIEKNQVAKVIKVESVRPKFTRDGKLPTLRLVDETKPKTNDSDLKSNPIFVGLLVCFSLVTSGVMLFVAGMQTSGAEKQVLESRARIRDFCEVRIDQDVAPYQLELREAQLANSRGDFRAEIGSYEKVMARFHAEDRNRFQGLTGSPTNDIELEEHVSVLLNEAKRRVKRGR